MNKIFLMGRLTKDAEVRVSQGENATAIARANLAVDRIKKDEADFPSLVAFGKRAEFLEKYGKRGTKFVVEGHLQTGSYTNKDGVKVYTTDVIVDNIEFAESKKNSDAPAEQKADSDGFMNIPDGLEELPFN